MFLHTCPFKTLFYQILVKWDLCPYLSDFSSNNRVTFPRGCNSSSVGKACCVTSPCLPLWCYLLLHVNFLALCLIFLYLLSGEVESGAENSEWDSEDDLWVGCWRIKRSLPSRERQLGSSVLGERQEHCGCSWMAVQGSSEWRLKHGGPQLNLVPKGNLLGPHYVKKIKSTF